MSPNLVLAKKKMSVLRAYRTVRNERLQVFSQNEPFEIIAEILRLCIIKMLCSIQTNSGCTIKVFFLFNVLPILESMSLIDNVRHLQSAETKIRSKRKCASIEYRSLLFANASLNESFELYRNVTIYLLFARIFFDVNFSHELFGATFLRTNESNCETEISSFTLLVFLSAMKV